jgi:hypothetical protein
MSLFGGTNTRLAKQAIVYRRCGAVMPRHGRFSGVHVLEQWQERRQRPRKLLFESPPKACLPRPMSRSGSPAFVPVMQAADLWDRDDSTGFGRLDTARFWRVFLQC